MTKRQAKYSELELPSGAVLRGPYEDEHGSYYTVHREVDEEIIPGLTPDEDGIFVRRDRYVTPIPFRGSRKLRTADEILAAIERAR